MDEIGKMNGDFFAYIWLVVFLVIIVAAIWLVKSKKRRTQKELHIIKEQLDDGEINEVEYEAKKRKILGD